jgi:hypothetical protein
LGWRKIEAVNNTSEEILTHRIEDKPYHEICDHPVLDEEERCSRNMKE